MHYPINKYEYTVQFEDVDAAMIVHHPVYLKYLERARCHNLIEKGCSIKKVLDAGFGIVVASVDMKYIRPLELEKHIIVGSQVDKFEKSIIYMTQVIATQAKDLDKTHLSEELRNIESLHFYAHIKLAIVSSETKKLILPPQWLVNALS